MSSEQLDFRRDINPNTLYELTSLLGEGSYGAVYKARSRIIKSGREVAVKIIPDADDDLTSLWREIKFLQDLRSPFVVSFIESLLFDNELWLVMELCDGGSLHDLKEARKAPFTEPQIQAIMAFSVLGLAHLHSQMSIHRDVKSGNILLTTDGRAKLGDFGISAQLTDTIMKRRTVIGSPYWMAPEVIQEASYDGKADIWSLGITLMELAEGSPPHFNVHPMRAIFIISARPAPTFKNPGQWSADMVDFLGKCLCKNTDLRSTAEELLSHPWIKRTVREISQRGNGLPILQDLIEDHWDEIERLRISRFKVPHNIDANVDEEDIYTAPVIVAPTSNKSSTPARPDATLVRDTSGNMRYHSDDSTDEDAPDFDRNRTLSRSNSFGVPATRQQIRNASLSRGSSRSTTPTGTPGGRGRNRSGSGPAPYGISPKDLAATFVAGQIVSDLYGEENGLSDDDTPRNSVKRMSSTLQPTRSKPLDFKSETGHSSSPGSAGVGGGDYKMEAGAGDDSTLVRAPRDRRTSSAATEDRNYRQQPQGPPDYGGGVGAEDDIDSGYPASGSLIRHSNGGLKKFSAGGASGAGGGIANSSTDVQSALKYFRDEPPAAGAKGTPELPPSKFEDSPQQLRGGIINDSKLYADDIVMAAEVLELEGDKQLQKQNLLIKKEITKLLSSLKKQYRDDLEELTKSYEARRKVLKDSIALLTNDAPSI